MSDINLNFIVIHELVKEQHKPIQSSNIRSKVLNKSNKAVLRLVQELTALYGNRKNSAHYGTFRVDQGRGVFPPNFENYAGLNTPNNQDFLNISIAGMDALYIKAEAKMASSGGYILFVDYSTNQGRFFLTAMVKQKEGIKLSEDLEPEELTQLDLNRLYQAARINFGKLSAYLSADENSKMELSYLSFVSPQSGKAASGYFVTALGCAPGVASGRATNTLIKESIKFFRMTEVLKPHVLDFKSDLVEYLQSKQKSGCSAKLTEVEALARPYMPANEDNSADEFADALITHLNSDENSVPVEFPISQVTLTKYTHIKFKADNYEMKFERGALGDTDSAEIYFDRKMNRIIFNNIPKYSIEIITKELESRASEHS